MTLLAVLVVAILAVALAVGTSHVVRWEERLTDADESVLAQWLRERREQEQPQL